MSRSVWILLLLLALWIIIGAFFWEKLNPFWNAGTSNEPCEISWELEDNSKVIAKSDATFNFTKSSTKLDKLDAGLTDAVTALSKYLKENKGKNLTVIGYHDKDETYEPSLYDLALARANVVKAMLTKNGVPANQLHVYPMTYKDNERSDCFNGNFLNRGVSFQMGTPKK